MIAATFPTDLNGKIRSVERALFAVQRVCPSCQRACSDDDFYTRARRCKECVRKSSREWIAANPERVRIQRRIERWRRYGLTPEEGARLLAEQNGECAICKESLIGGRHSEGDRAYVDHDHATGRVRGLLCIDCNTLIGFAKDNTEILKAACRYLDGGLQ